MEPHVFARFERLSFGALFEFDDDDNAESPLVIDRDYRFNVEEELRFGEIISQSNLIRNLVSLISKPPFLNYLDVVLDIDLPLGFEAEPEPPSEAEKALQEEEDDRLQQATEHRAVEIFLDNNMLAPLGTLFNVKSFNSRLAGPCKLQSRHVKMVQDLKEKIERNWQLRQAAK